MGAKNLDTNTALQYESLVSQAGRPKALTLWMAAAKQDELGKAVRTNRVLTLRSLSAMAGRVGFHPQSESLYLIFPRRIPVETGQLVIGIHSRSVSLARPRRSKCQMGEVKSEG
ncbi:MAG: hypothetical protein QOF48_223 [Verrucomicrobiota bacterium]|jgi:hypothetical protein